MSNFYDDGTLKTNKELTPLKALQKAKMDMDYHRKYECHYYYPKEEREEYFSIIENALKDYEELTNRPVILYERTHANAQAFIDYICKNYKEVKITCLEDKKKLKALEIIKETPEFAWYVKIYKNAYEMASDVKGFRVNNSVEELQEMFDLLKEVLK